MHRILLSLLAVGVFFLASCGGNKTSEFADLTNPAYQAPDVKAITVRIAKDTGNAQLYYDRGNALHRLQMDSLALKDFIKATTLNKTRAEYYSAVGDLMFENGDVTGSVDWLKTAVKLDPEDPKAHLKIAKMFLFNKDYKEAFQELNTVLRKDVYNPEAYFLKGMVYKDQKDTARAVSSFQTAIQVSPDFRDAYLQLAAISAARNDSTALRYYENAFRVDSSDVFPLYARGKYLQDRKLFDRAKEEYKNLLAHNRNYSDAHFAIGYILLQQDSTEKAIPHFTDAINTNPNDPNAYYNRGLCQEIGGNTDAARADYRQALAIAPDFPKPKEGLQRLDGGQ